MVKNISMWLVLEPLLYSKEFMHLADISRKLKKPHATVRKYLNYFEKQGLIIKDKKGRLTLYKLNYKNPLVIDYLSIVEKERVIEKCKRDLAMKEIVHFLHKFKNEILIFGSAVDGTKKANDIDVLFLGRIRDISYMKKFEKRLGVKFHIINLKQLKDVTPSLKNDVTQKHLIVQGVEKWVKWMLKD
ncbi:MAG: helix-turn-helix transcriptional regulator [Nanoarchaeota archaeon]|nr:helix-turn-helix transcriptional regulator [Nanoarchaeota archaeon]